MYVKDVKIFHFKCQVCLLYNNYTEDGIDKVSETIPRLIWTVSLLMSAMNVEREVAGNMLHIF